MSLIKDLISVCDAHMRQHSDFTLFALDFTTKEGTLITKKGSDPAVTLQKFIEAGLRQKHFTPQDLRKACEYFEAI